LLLLGPDAQERQFKSIRHPRAVMLCTHGFYLAESKERGGEQTALPDNPLLRCGLLFAGCNRRGLLGSAEDDGVLTGLEIVSTDLRGTQLVVLSACDTAVGQVTSGEGVAGLRQAFQLAGAETVLGSLWSVPDKETEQLMSEFWKQLVRSRSTSDALQEAQVGAIRLRRATYRAAHPFFWAAFTVTGQ
jgi:CHAT domain-containing protein